MGDIVLVRIGTETDGDPARVCPHMAQWWPLYTQLVKLKLGITLEIIQAAGSYSKSGATHVEGTAIDWRTWRFRDSVVDDAVELAREGGAPATWMRSKRRFGQKFDDHVHLALDCPCRSGADYQIAAVKAGYNGLGYRGRGGKDYHPKPDDWRDWSTGMAWINAELDRLTPKPAPTLTATQSEEDDMPYTPAELKAIVRDALHEQLKGESSPVLTSFTTERGHMLISQAAYAAIARSQLAAMIRSVAAAQGAEVDPRALAREVAEAMAPTLREVVVTAVGEAGGSDADQVADAVVARFGAALVQG